MRALVLLLIALPSFAAAQPPPGDVPPPPPGDVPPPPLGDVPPPPADVPPPPPAYDPATGGAVPPPAPPGVAAQPVGPGPGAYTHDGFHLRMAIGVGGGSVARTTRNDSVSGERESTVEGGAFALEITIGGTIGPVVLGGVLALAAMGDEQIEYDDGGDPTALDGSFNVWLLGFAADWYPSPEGGFHAGGAIGFMVAQGRVPEGSRASDLGIEQVGGAGFGLSLVTGYDFWIGEQWSMGPLLRMTIGQGHGEGELTTGTHVEEDDAAFAITLLFSAALH